MNIEETRKRAARLAADEARACLSSWTGSGAAPLVRASAGPDLLAAWANLGRLDPGLRPGDLCLMLKAEIEASGAELLETWRPRLSEQAWEGTLASLEKAVADAQSAEAEQAVEEEALRLFCLLDQEDLAFAGAAMLGGEHCDKIEEARDTLSVCRVEWINYAWLFWPAQWYAADVASAFRAGLAVSGGDLGLTAVKFDVLIGQAATVEIEWLK